jgi:hypothetical protein
MSPKAPSIVGAIVGWAARLRFPYLFALTAGLFAADLIVPDVLPFADEILLGLATAVLASWRRRREEPVDEERDVTGGA